MIHKRTMMNWTTSLTAPRQDTAGAQAGLTPPTLNPATPEEIRELVMVVAAITYTFLKGGAVNRAVNMESLRKTNSTIIINLPPQPSTRERHTRKAMVRAFPIDQKRIQTPEYSVRTTHSSTFQRTLRGILPETRTRTKAPTQAKPIPDWTKLREHGWMGRI